MKHTVIFLLGGVMAFIISIPQVVALFATHKESNNLGEQDEIRQTVKLAPGTRVEVSSIRGSVEIETADIDSAEIHIVRSAQSRAELEQYKVSIENKQQGLIIRGEQRQGKSGSGFGPDVRHQVILRLPRRVDLSIQSIGGEVGIGDVGGQLTVSSISGSLNVGAVDGQVQVSGVSGAVTLGRVNRQVEIKSVSGNVKIEQVLGALNVSGISGVLSAGISKLAQGGVQVNSVSGQVELRFRDELNAQLSTDNITGTVSIEVPNVNVQSRSGASAIRAMIGKGGPTISINGVSNGVRLAQGT
jgi:DUF4097 and DUF4098 domain-containing protein YvlB